MRESTKRAIKKYKEKYKEKIEVVRFELYPTDTDIKNRIAEVLESGETKAGYLKRLIREDIEKR